MESINYHKIDEAISAIQRGGPVIVVDDEAREDEGDFVCAAETITGGPSSGICIIPGGVGPTSRPR